MANFVRTPWHLWVLAVLGVVWFAGGAFDYVMTSTQNEAYLAQLTNPQRAWLDARPTWFTAAWAISIWSSLLGAVVMLFRSKWAATLFWISLGAYLVACVWSYGLSDPSAMQITGWFGLIFSAIIGLSLFFFATYCSNQRARGVLR